MIPTTQNHVISSISAEFQTTLFCLSSGNPGFIWTGKNTRSLPTPSFVSRRILISTMAVMPSGITMTGSIFFRMPRNGIFFLNYCLRSVRFCILIIFTDCRNMSACFPIFFTVTPATESSLLMPFCIFSCMLYRKSWKKIPTIPACRSIILPSPDSGHRSTIIRRITGASRLWRILWP